MPEPRRRPAARRGGVRRLPRQAAVGFWWRLDGGQGAGEGLTRAFGFSWFGFDYYHAEDEIWGASSGPVC